MRQTWPSIFAPPVFDNEESTRKAHILHLILWMSFGAFFIATLLVFFVFPLPIQFLSLLVIGGGLTLGMLYVLQRGAFRLASIGFLGGIWLIVFLMTVYSGGTRSFSAYLITLVILGTGLLLGSRASFMVAGGNTLAMIGLALYENRFGLPPPLLTITPVSASLELTFNYWWGAIILYLATHTIEVMLDKSQKMSVALTEANMSLQRSEQKYRTLVEEAADGIFIPDPQGKIIEVNRQGCELLGYTRDELLELTIMDLIPFEMRSNYHLHLEDLPLGKSVLLERPLLRKDGTIIQVEINAQKMDNGQLQAIIRNISERKRVEAELQASHIRFRNFVDHATDSFFLHDKNGLILDVNRQAYESLGYTREELIAVPPNVLDPLVDETTLQKIGERLAAEKFFTFESVHRRKDGTLIPVEINLRQYEENGQTFGISLARDITERKKAEAERQTYMHVLESLDRINQAIQSTNDIQTMMRAFLEIILETFACDRVWLLTPCDPEAISWSIPIEVTRPPYTPAYLPELAMPLDEEMAQLFHHMRATGKPLASIAGGESPLPSVMQKEFKAQAQLSLTIQPKNAPCYLLGMQQCSTPRAWLLQEERLFQEMGQRLETALNSLMIFHNLRENEQKLEQAQRMARLGYWEVDLVSGLVSQSAELWHIFGLEEQVVSTDLLSWMEIWQKYITPEDFKSNMDILLHSISQNQPFELQMSVTTPQGEQRYAFSRGHATLDSNGNPLRIFGMSQDITKIKETEQALQEREILYRTLFEQASDGVILHDALTGKATAANQAYTNMMECEISDVLGTGIAEGVPSDEVEDSITRWHQILQAGHLSPYERRVITHQGHMKYFEITASTIYDLSSGSPHLIQAVVRDVTHRKQAEEQLQAALQEKEILLKEIHHRVKNNLQVISSLLYLQSLKITEPSMLELFRESRNRVAAMALVHEQLYQSENFARVDFSTYVRALVTSLYESYGVTDTEIPLKIETDGTALDVHTAIPCGLLISEMVSNALKYAFPDGHGQIAISLRSDGKAHHLTVQDSGIGIPEDSVVRAGAMGLQLIERLTLQIGGTLQRSGPPGTMYHIQFPRQSH